MTWLKQLLFVFLVCTEAMAMFEGSFLYFPSHKPNDSTLAEWKVGGSLAGYCRERPEPKSVWLVFHGNAGQACDRLYIVDRLPPDASVYVLEYPGYGLRKGKPSMDSINAAAEQAFRELQLLHSRVPIGVVGESIGSGPASYLCSLKDPPAQLVLFVPFDTLLSVAKRHMRFLPVSLLMRDKWDNVASLGGYKGQVIIYGALHDTVIPIEHARNLAKAVPGSRFIELPCGHNEWANLVAPRQGRAP